MVRSKTMMLMTVAICCLAICFGCARETKVTYHPETGVKTSKTETVGGSVKSSYRADLVLLTEMGVGEWSDKNKALAREAALTIAISDLAEKVGKVLIMKDSRIFNDDAMLHIQKYSANVVKGYEIILDDWDPETHMAKVRIQQNIWRVVQELERHYPLNWAAAASE